MHPWHCQREGALRCLALDSSYLLLRTAVLVCGYFPLRWLPLARYTCDVVCYGTSLCDEVVQGNRGRVGVSWAAPTVLSVSDGRILADTECTGFCFQRMVSHAKITVVPVGQPRTPERDAGRAVVGAGDAGVG